ncbi:type VI secretion system baseplate subunit TssF [Candidatus Methylospira mobilis]|uniref:Type VI secretion system baseplate subunit TssF n=1 Tax=Candidatus Methylospira mobilis TaxID=1808979 RepID=A0A5Q0BJ66_9GAMM|nr:type VI secretion system baseplate subunit TssF [Candidatus Methylospira mobilis]QFY43172.1 type VI secretion system baseplate subunit TssF [Candidatus Methylospira mobilis]WNV03624.1 type VI secretion system baseplate subunit TssF [Candidatus Methylospira mobilis]
MVNFTNNYYASELSALRELGREFAEANPTLAPMLTGASADPDVERLLEGVAFLTGLVRQKLDDDFPQIAQEMSNLIFPQFLRQLPCAALIQFLPALKLNDTAVVKRNTELASVPVDGTSCRFKTIADLDVHPIKLAGSTLKQAAGQAPVLQLRFAADGIDLAEFKAQSLRLFLGLDMREACNWFYALQETATRVRLVDGGKQPVSLGVEALVCRQYDVYLTPYPPQAFPKHQLLQDYLQMPEKLLFIDIEGLSNWKKRSGNEFSIEIEFDPGIYDLHLKSDVFMLNVVPALNLFNYAADPIQIDHKQIEYRIRPQDDRQQHYAVYRVDQVRGLRQGEHNEIDYQEISHFSVSVEQAQNIYRLFRRPHLSGKGIETLISVVYPQGVPEKNETLSIRMTCSNGGLPERLRPGDISVKTDSSPERFTFKNLNAPTPQREPCLHGGMLWSVLSFLSLNYNGITSVEALRELLRLLATGGHPVSAASQGNLRRIDGLKRMEIFDESRLFRGTPLRGRRIRLYCDESCFNGKGDLYLFGCVMDRFFAASSEINTYSKFELVTTGLGEIIKWPERVANHRLISLPG